MEFLIKIVSKQNENYMLCGLVAGVVAGFRGRAVCWSFEGLQLRSER